MLQCLTRDKALSVVKDDGKADLSEDDYQQLSTLLLYYVVNLEDLCASLTTIPSSSSSENDQFYVLALTSLHPDEDTKFLSSSEIESILQLINQHYHPSNQETSQDLQVSDGSICKRWKHLCIEISKNEDFMSDPAVCWSHKPSSRSEHRRRYRCWSIFCAQTGCSHHHSHPAGSLYQTPRTPIPRFLHRLCLSITEPHK